MSEPNEYVVRALTEVEGVTDPAEAIQRFLEHMEKHYSGDYYIEGCLGYLAEYVREAREISR